MEKFIGKKVLRTRPTPHENYKGFMDSPIVITKITENHFYYTGNGDNERILSRHEWDDGNWCLWEGTVDEEAKVLSVALPEVIAENKILREKIEETEKIKGELLKACKDARKACSILVADDILEEAIKSAKAERSE